ncbi:hypothetical protein [Nitrosophilus labii]|uniref:hypothetical protein n=1 Tax=Nitrosophilus labii TaxID=2706014 RepID=UPI0016575630|nr:hypothetical protein [Nitrosophilus labii]
MEIALYFHLLAATAWIGGSVFLFALGIFLRDKVAQKNVYLHIGPLYGYFESVWLIVLIGTGLHMFFGHGLDQVLKVALDSSLGQVILIKILLVTAITIFTVVHMYIAFKTHGKERTKIELLISRASSMMIFVLNLVILWYAAELRTML